MAKIQIKFEKLTPLESFSDNPPENGRCPPTQNGLSGAPSMQSGEPTVTGNKGDVTREGEVLVIPTQKGERIIISCP